MTIPHTIKKVFERSGESFTSGNVYSSGQEVNLDVSIADAATDLEVPYALDISQVQSFYMKSDKAITVKTNVAGAPDKTFTLAADKAVTWESGDHTPNGTFFGIDITKLFVTNASGAAASLKIRCIIDPTV